PGWPARRPGPPRTATSAGSPAPARPPSPPGRCRRRAGRRRGTTRERRARGRATAAGRHRSPCHSAWRGGREKPGDRRNVHNGTEIVDPATLRFFLLALQRTPDERWLALCQGERNWFEAADTPFVIQRLGLSVTEGRLHTVELRLAGDYREPLDPTTLEHDG